jgi:hypothetical protein
MGMGERLTAPQEEQVLVLPGMEELHLGQVVWALTRGCMLAAALVACLSLVGWAVLVFRKE